MLALCLENRGHLFTLPLGPQVRSNSPLQEFQASLVLGDLQQLHGATLIGSESGDFTDEVPDEFVVGSVLALAGAWLEGVDGGLVAFVEAGTNLVPRSHGSIFLNVHKILNNW